MRRALLSIMFLTTIAATAQTQINPVTQVNWAAATGNVAPTRYCPTSTTGSTVNGSPIVTVAATTDVMANQAAVGSSVPSGAVVVSVNATTYAVTLSAAATTTASGVSLTFSSFGMPYTNTTSGQQYTCTAAGWTAVTGTVYPGVTSNGSNGLNVAGTLSSPAMVPTNITPSTSPVCANGTGGALTTTGCTGGLPLSGGTLTGALNGTSASFSGNVVAATIVPTSLPPVGFNNVACFGDSLCQGGEDNTGISQVSALGLLSRRTALNYGIGGQTSAQIGTRLNAFPSQQTFAAGFTLPTSGSVVVTFPAGYEPAHGYTGANGSSYPAAGVPISFVVSGTTYIGNLLDNGSQIYNFTPTVYPGSPVTVPGGTAWAAVIPAGALNGCVFLVSGRNDIKTNPSAILPNLVASVAMISAATSCYGVETVLNGQGEGSGTSLYTTLMGVNASIESTFGAHAFDTRTNLVAQANPSFAADAYDESQDIPPLSLLADDADGTLTSAITTTTQQAFGVSSYQYPYATLLMPGGELIQISAVTGGTSITGATRGFGSTTAATYGNSTAYNGIDQLHPGQNAFSAANPWFQNGYVAMATYLYDNWNALAGGPAWGQGTINSMIASALENNLLPIHSAAGQAFWNQSFSTNCSLAWAPDGHGVYLFGSSASVSCGFISHTAGKAYLGAVGNEWGSIVSNNNITTYANVYSGQSCVGGSSSGIGTACIKQNSDNSFGINQNLGFTASQSVGEVAGDGTETQLPSYVAASDHLYGPYAATKITNYNTSGVLLNGTACIQSAGSVGHCHATDTQWVGIVTGGATGGSAGSASISYAGKVSLILDNQSVIGDCIIMSTSSNSGEAHDTGSPACTQSSALIGIALSANSGAGTTALVMLHPVGTPISSTATTSIAFRTAVAHATSAITETILYSAAITPSLMSSTSRLSIASEFLGTSAGGTCQFAIYLNTSAAIGGTSLFTLATALTSGGRTVDEGTNIWMRGATNSEVFSSRWNYSTGVTGNLGSTSSVDMTGTPYIVVTGTASTASDTCTLNAIDGLVTQ